MERDDSRVRFLESAGFHYNKAAGCWIHRDAGRVLSQETVTAHDLAWLRAWIAGK
jgi:hypothetical protein